MRIFNFNIFAEVESQTASASDRSELDMQTTIALSELVSTNKKAAGKITLEDFLFLGSPFHPAGFNISLDAALESTDPISFDSTVSADVNTDTNSTHKLRVHNLAITNKTFEG